MWRCIIVPRLAKRLTKGKAQMATWEDVGRIALELPGVTQDEEGRGYGVMNRDKSKGIAWQWRERVDPKRPKVPNIGVVVLNIADEEEKRVLIAADNRKFFTEPHYNGYPAILVRLAEVEFEELCELITDSWRYKATGALIAAYERQQAGNSEAEAERHAMEMLQRVRACCATLPDSTERPSHGAPSFFLGERCYAMFMNNHHEDGRLALWCASTADAREIQIASDPNNHFVPPYVGHRGWIGVRLDRDLSWEEIEGTLAEAYHTVQAKRRRG